MTENSTYMTREEILNTIEILSHSQGYYGVLNELLKNLRENNLELYEMYVGHLQELHFKDPVDLVMYFEN